MKKHYNILFNLMLIVTLAACDSIHEDRYVGNIESVIQKLGNDYQLNIYMVNQSYRFRSEMEPDYYLYFSDEEIESGVEIFEYIWNKGRKNIFIWSKKSCNGIEIFSSIEFNGNVKF